MRSSSKRCARNRSAATSAPVRWPRTCIGISRGGRCWRDRRDAAIAPANSCVGIALAVSLVLSLLAGLGATAWQARAKTLEAQKAEAVKAFLISIFQGAD